MAQVYDFSGAAFGGPQTREEAISRLLGQTPFLPKGIKAVQSGGQYYQISGSNPTDFKLNQITEQQARALGGSITGLEGNDLQYLMTPPTQGLAEVPEGFRTFQTTGAGSANTVSIPGLTQRTDKDQGAAPTEYQTYFNEQRAAGKTPEQISQEYSNLQRQLNPQNYPAAGTPTYQTAVDGVIQNPNQATKLLPAVNPPIPASEPQPEGYVKGYDTNNGYAPVWVQAGHYYPGISLYGQDKSGITVDSLKQEEKINLSGTTNASGTTGESDAFVAGANTTLSEYIKQLTPPKTESDVKEQSLLDKMASLTGELAQQAADQLTAEQSAGIPELKKQFADINTQILAKTAEYKQIRDAYDQASVANRNKPITMNSIIGNEAQINYAKQAELNRAASDIGLLQAQALGLQGQIQTAQDTVNRAIDLKYSSIQSRLDVYEAQLRAIQPTLNKEERTLAQAQQILLDNQRQALADAKQNEKNIQDVMLQAIKSGITDTNVLDSISKATSYEKALTLLGANIPEDTNYNTQVIGSPTTGYKLLTYDDAGNIISTQNVTGASSGGGGGGGGGYGGGGLIPSITTPISSLTNNLPTFEEYLAQKENEALQTFTPQRRQQVRAEYEALKAKAAQNDPQELVDLANIKASAISEKNKREFFLNQVNSFLERGEFDKARSVIAGTGKSLTTNIADDLTQARLAKENINRIAQLVENLGAQGPAIGQFRKRNPYDDAAVELQNLITQTVPGLARGIFKEVGVLTDQDIERYRKTIASESLTLEQARDATRNLVDTINTSIELQLDTLGRSGYDVSKFEDIRDEVNLPQAGYTKADEDYIKSLGL